MRKGVIAVLIFAVILSVNLVVAADCDLSVSLLNQDPYPAVPGDSIKVVFQISGISSSECGDLEFAIDEDFPFTIDPSSESYYLLKAGTYTKDYSSYFQAPFTLRVDEEALDGENLIEFKYKSSRQILGSYLTKQFNIEVEDVRADFEVYVKDYDYSTHELTLEVLNIAEVDVEALTFEIPKQKSLQIKGPNRIVVGDLDSNEYTTADFEAEPMDGDFTINLIYSDGINTRRTKQKVVTFDSSYFTKRISDEGGSSTGVYIFWIAVIAIGLWWWNRRRNKKKALMKKRQ